MHLYDIIQVRPTYAVRYPYHERMKSRAASKYMRYYKLTGDTHQAKGKMSKNARRRMRYAIQLLTASATWKDVVNPSTNEPFKFKLAFVTLTLPCDQDTITDGEIKRKCLNNYIAAIRSKYGSFNYVWRAEAQANGNIHFHIATDLFLTYGQHRYYWNKALHKVGYIEQYKRNQEEWHQGGFRPRIDLFKTRSYTQQHRAYRFGIETSWTQPNTIDVHSVRKVKNLENYMMKYMAKDNDERRPIVGKIWGCSEALGYKNKFETTQHSESTRELLDWLEDKKLPQQEGQRFAIYAYTWKDFETNAPRKVYFKYKAWLKGIRQKPAELSPHIE